MRRSVLFLATILANSGGLCFAIGEETGSQGLFVRLRAPGLSDEERTQALVLASPHLSQQLPGKTGLDGIGELLEALRRFRPDLVAVEQLSGEQIETYERLGGAFQTVVQTFAPRHIALRDAAQRVLRLDGPEARKRAGRSLQTLESRAAVPADRKQAALLLGAGGELAAAALQWSYLEPEHRKPDDVIPLDAAVELDRELENRSETVVVGVALARLLGLQRVYGVDDQSDAPFQLRHGAELMAELANSSEFEGLKRSVLYTELPERIRRHAEASDFLGLYRWMNAPGYGQADVDAQWHLFHRARLNSGLDRRRVALWETRNLAIAANIRRAIGETGARRAIVIIGASHKPFLDAYLSCMMDIEVVSAGAVLGE